MGGGTCCLQLQLLLFALLLALLLLRGPKQEHRKPRNFMPQFVSPCLLLKSVTSESELLCCGVYHLWTYLESQFGVLYKLM